MLISELRVDNFRSIKSAKISPLSRYEPVVGLNSSGKSNLLRALKLFFTGTVDEQESSVNLSRDYCDYSPTKNRSISVGVVFVLNGTVKYPRQASFISGHSLVETLAIRHTWYLDSQTRSMTRRVDYGKDLDHLAEAKDPKDQATLDAFVRSIEFRYVPNHARPSDLINQYVNPLREVLVSRLRATKEYKAGDASGLLSAMGRLGETLFHEASLSVTRGIKNLAIQSSLPTDFADLVFDLAIRSVDVSGQPREPELEGSGTQQFMFLHLLDLADRASRSRGFGWVQGSIWAVEEPESFLHAGLRQRFATDLYEYSGDPRRQVFVTTHQDEFLRVGTSAIMASRDSGPTSFDRMPPKDALRKSTQLAITTYRHPLLQYPNQPIVIMEGKFDAFYLRAALSASSIKPRWRLADPDDLTGEDMGGDAFKNYLRYNQPAIEARAETAPILVVRDWETKDADAYKKILKVHEHSTAVVMPSSLANNGLGESWVGIERYLPSDFVDAMVPPSDMMRRGGPDGPREIDRPVLHSHKQALAAAFDIKAYPAPELVALLEWIDAQVTAILAPIPGSAFI